MGKRDLIQQRGIGHGRQHENDFGYCEIALCQAEGRKFFERINGWDLRIYQACRVGG